MKRNSDDRALRSVMRLFADDVSVIEENRLNEQRHTDDEFRQSFEATVNALARVEALQDDADIQALIDGAIDDTKVDYPGKPEKSRWRHWATAATVMVAGVLGFNYYLGDSAQGSDSNILRYVTRVGEQKKVTLTDGSVITLNTGTQLLVDIGDTSRKITLERGEAYFDVVRDAVRPFTVDMGGKAVSVLGTEFNIQKSAEGFTLAVVEGAVAIHSPNEVVLSAPRALSDSGENKVSFINPSQRRIDAGWAIEYDLSKNQLVGHLASNLSHYHAWRTGMLKFAKVPLYKVVQELNRYSGKKILIEDKSVMDIEVYAALRIDQLESALLGLEKGNPIKVNHYFDRIVILSDK